MHFWMAGRLCLQFAENADTEDRRIAKPKGDGWLGWRIWWFRMYEAAMDAFWLKPITLSNGPFFCMKLFR